MASKNLLTLVGGLEKQIASSAETIDFLSIKVGASALEILEATGKFDFSAKVLSNIANGTAAGQALSYTQRGAANGVASLDAGSKVPISQLPNSIMEFQGVWNATTNTPALVDGTGSIGDVYRVNVAGSQDLGSGSQTFVIGDWVMLDAGLIWRLAHAGADIVASVFGRAGVVVATAGDYTASQITNVPAGTIAAVTVQAALDELDSEKVPTTRTINGFALSANVALVKADIGLGNVDNLQQIPLSYLDTDGTLAANSDVKVASQKAVKTYVDTSVAAFSLPTLAFTNDNAGAITVRQAVYVKSNGAVDLAKADALSTSGGKLGLVSAASIAAAGSGLITINSGVRVSGFSGLTPGGAVYLSAATAGALTQTAPSTVGQVIAQVGHALSASVIEFDPEPSIEILS